MERTQLPTTRHRLLAKVRTTALALLLGTTALCTSGQDQFGFPLFNEECSTSICPFYLRLFDYLSPGCDEDNKRVAVVPISTPWGQNYGGVDTYYTLPAGNGNQTFAVHLETTTPSAFWAVPTYQVFIDGVYCSSCTATVTYHNGTRTFVNVTHNAGAAWPSGVHEFGLRQFMPASQGATPTPVCDWRFKAVMVGQAYTEQLGFYDAPALPLFILRDPPGGESYASMSQGTTTCSGFTQSATTGSEESNFVKAKIGIAGSIGWIVDLPFEIYGEFGVDMTAEHSETSALDYETCFEAVSDFTTSASGTPDDMFIGSAIRYAYGTMITIQRPTCGTITTSARLASEAVEVLESFHHTESYIRSTLIPQITAQIATLTPGTLEHEKKTNQLNVWNQALALNDSIKAAAPFVVTRAFSGGGAGQNYSQTTTTTLKRSIDYTVALDNGLSAEFGAYFGGSGVAAGGSIRMRNEYGSGQGSSNQNTNSMAYHLEDGDVFDNHTVGVYKDEVFGSYVFKLDSANSRTSCKYEGGYPLDQPQLSVGTAGNTSMALNEVPIGTAANFPLVICNNSDTTRTYYLKFDAPTNTQGAVMQAFGNTLNSNDNGIELELLGGQCLNTNLALTQPNVGVVDFDNINLRLYSLCEEEYPPYVRSYVTISAHYGTGNFGNYCLPVSVTGTTLGDYVDGVQLASINNTGTGGVSGASYTDYSGSISTPLSRNAQKIIGLTSGANAGGHYAAWIDYDHSGSFDANEKLGVFTSAAAGTTQTIAFTVPGNAALGSTILRVRGVKIDGGEPGGPDPCFNYNAGETEDYAVVIDANTPQDCAGVNNGPALPGTACNDGNANTANDTWSANCLCVGLVIDCAGVPGGTTSIGSPCDDGDANTAGDVYNASCLCVGLSNDCLGVPGGTALEGAACDDGDAGTGNDVYNASCQCAGQLIDCLGTIGGSTTVGTACDDGNPLSGGDAYAANCECVGAFATDCAGVAGGTAQPGTACDDNNGATGNDTYGVNCTCAGVPFDCAGNPGGIQLPGTPCDDGNSASNNDTFTAECVCEGVFANDCLGVPGGTALPGAACDDGNADTGNDVYNAFCECAGQLTDCNGVIGGPAQPGFGCDDGNPATGFDVIDENCVCVGQLIDCLGLPGGEALVGSACDDANASTSNDVYTANCICAGVLPNDCEGVVGGTAQPGTTCDDGDATTGNDVYGTNCACAGELIDCEGTIGGVVLPGTPCDDGVACTANDVRGTDCVCSGTTITIGAVSGSTLVFGNTSNVYLVAPVANANSYSWTLPNGWTTSDNSAFALVAEVGNTPGPVELCVTATVGACEVTSCVTVTVDFNTGTATSDASSADWFTVQPNPSNGIFSILPSDEGKEPVHISVHDAVGRNVIAPFTLSLERSFPLDMGNVAPGAYYLLATRGDRKQVVKLVVQR